MTDLLGPGTGLFYMKVGTHAREALRDIVARKLREIDAVGYTLWGYGGSTCHPLTVVQPFARDRAKHGAPILLCTEEMQSEHYFGEPFAAAEYSADGREWLAVPDAIRVVGSRYALPIRNLRIEENRVSLSRTRVAAGPAAGLSGDRYILGRIDKACLIADPEKGGTGDERTLGLVAEVVAPYAVFLRDFRPAENSQD